MKSMKVEIHTSTYYRSCGCCTEGDYVRYQWIRNNRWIYSWSEYYQGSSLEIHVRTPTCISGDNIQVLLFPLGTEAFENLDFNESILAGNKI